MNSNIDINLDVNSFIKKFWLKVFWLVPFNYYITTHRSNFVMTEKTSKCQHFTQSETHLNERGKRNLNVHYFSLLVGYAFVFINEKRLCVRKDSGEKSERKADWLIAIHQSIKRENLCMPDMIYYTVVLHYI